MARAKKRQGGRKRQKPMQRKRSRMPTGIPSALVPMVCSQIDPFCEHAVGAGRFDESTVPSLRFTVRQQVSITTGTSGGKLVEINPSPQLFLRSVDVDGAGAQLGSWSATTVLNEFGSGGIFQEADYRVVVAGIRIINTTSYLSSQGRFRVLCTSERLPTTGNVYGASYPDSATYPFVGGMEVTALHRSQGPKSSNYYPANSGSNITMNFLQLWLVGAGDAATYTIETFYHYELTPTTQMGAVAGLAKPAAAPNPRIMRAAAIADSSLPSSTAGPVAAASRMLKDAAASGLRMAANAGLSALAARFGGPSAMGLPALGSYVMEVD